MTSNFDYTDDSVVAKISVDIPTNAATDIAQMQQATSGLRVELEAAARAQGDWASYLREIPQLAEQAAQAQRSLITALERTSYLQGQAGPGRGGAGQPGPGGQYSTAAPAGYVNPFTGQPGQGTLGHAQDYMQNMANQDPRLFANMQAQRGNAVNPAQLGLVGGTAVGGTGGVGGMGGGQGQGAAAPASSSPQGSQSSRDSAAPPDPSQSGAPTTSEPPNIPADPHADAPAWQSQSGGIRDSAQQILNEVRSGSGSKIGMLGLAAKGMSAAGSWATSNPDRLAKLGGIGGTIGKSLGGLSGIAKGAAGVAGGVGAALALNHLIQNVGEATQEYSNLGAIRGGSFGEGVGLETQAQMMAAMNPFINSTQTRQIMQEGLKSGLQGDQLDTFDRGAMQALKDQNMSPADFGKLFVTQLSQGGVAVQAFTEEISNAKEYAKTGFTTLPERQAQMAATSSNLGAMGVHGQALANSTTAFTEGFADDPILGRNGAGANIMNQAVSNPMFQTMMGMQAGQGGHLPGSILMRLSDGGGGGINDAADDTMKFLVGQVANVGTDIYDKANAFQQLAAQMGMNMTPQQALAMYKKYAGGDTMAASSKRRSDNVATQRRSDSVSLNPMKILGNAAGQISDIFDPLIQPLQGNTDSDRLKSLAAIPGEMWAGITGDQSHTYNSRKNPDPSAPDVGDLYKPIGRPAAPPSKGGGGQHVTTQGSVNGTLQITVDQQGKVSAPQSIQLTGQQKQAYMGYGSAQLNDPSPGDASYYHANNGWGN
jgi:hypothetical protein